MATSQGAVVLNTYKPSVGQLRLISLVFSLTTLTHIPQPSFKSSHFLTYSKPPTSTAAMKISQLTILAALSVIPALARPEPSELLNARARVPTFTCTSGYSAVCCETFVVGLGDEPTVTGVDCTPESNGCESGLQPACCALLVSTL